MLRVLEKLLTKNWDWIGGQKKLQSEKYISSRFAWIHSICNFPNVYTYNAKTVFGEAVSLCITKPEVIDYGCSCCTDG